jgi:glycosyltransferase involved in cell wall biosynthesis
VLPLIRAEKPDVRVAVVGRNPPPSLTSLADTFVTVTGTVPDVRSYLWESAISIVPLQVGGGTRLKIFEAMAAETAVVSTTVGAEGLPVAHGKTIRIADDAQSFARECLDLLNNPAARTELVRNALSLIQARFCWAQVTRDFEETLCSVHASATRFA